MKYTVIWNGRGPLLPERAEHPDTRFASMPSFDLDEDVRKSDKPKRQYNKTGRYKGVFSRTNPAATQFKPTEERV